MGRESRSGDRLGTLLVVAFVVALVAASAPAGTQRPSQTTTRPTQVTVVEPDGFDWGDAGIGALAAFGTVSVVAGVALVIRSGRRHPVAALAQSSRKETR